MRSTALAITMAVASSLVVGNACRTAPATSVASPLSPAISDPEAPLASLPPPSMIDPPRPRGEQERTFTHYDVNHVLMTGQSLSVGFKGEPHLTKTQPYKNKSFMSGVIGDAYGLGSWIPLVEGDVVGAGGNAVMYVETMASAFANLVTKESLEADDPDIGRHDLLVSIHGVSGSEYAGLRKGTKAYALGMKQVAAGKALAEQNGLSYVVRAVTTVHGEADHMGRNARYEANVIGWQADYERDVQAITGQTEPVPLLQTQMSAWTALGQSTSAIPLMQLAAHEHAPGKVILVGPKYHLPYIDGLHLTSEGYRHMGEDYAKVYKHVVLDGKTWEPLRPKLVERSGDTIEITFYVPSPPLVFDTKLVKDPGNYGFSYADDGPGSPHITAVEIAGDDRVRIRLSAEPTAGSRRIRYAMFGPPNVSAGPWLGARGNLRDSDRTVSRHGYALYDWCIHFDEAVP